MNMKWIKASERLPFKEDYYYIKTSEGGMNVRMISQKDTFYREFEWLDETPEEWISVVKDVLFELQEYLNDKADADHDGENYIPNTEMKLLSSVNEALNKMPLPSPPNK